ncbi:MAG: ABC transporter substrate-binding protein [Vulcanibacillus sp.]
MMKKSFLWITIIILLVGILAGCSTNSSETDQTNNNLQSINSSETIYPLSITDYTGSEVLIPAEPQRIITFFPSNTEILYELDLDGRVIAVTIYDNYPVNIQEKVEYVFDDGLNPNIEQILNLKPDLIVLGAHDDQLIDSLKKLNIPVVKYNPQSISEVYQTIEDLGVITNKKDEALKLITDMQAKEQLITSKVASIDSKESVWVEIASDLWTCGTETFMNELIEKAGGINIVDQPGWIQYSEEKVIEKNPKVIFTTYGYYDPNAVANVLNREGWTEVDAIKNNRVYDINSDLVSRPGPRVIDAMEEFAKAIYPDLFN